MDGYISVSNLALLTVTAAVLVSAVFLIIFLKNLTDCVKVVRSLLKNNMSNIDESLKNMPAITKNISEMSETANREVKAIESAISSIGTAVEETSATVIKIKNDFGEISNLVRALKFIKRLFRSMTKNSK